MAQHKPQVLDRTLRLTLWFVIVVFAVCLGLWVGSRVPTLPVVATPGRDSSLVHAVPEADGGDEPAQIMFVGDVMLGRGVAGRMAQHGGPEESFAYVRDIFRVQDYVVANLEGPISDRGTNVGSKYSFRFPREAAGWLAEAGVDLVSTANNHAWDYGRVALCDTLEHLANAGVAHVGTGCDEGSANAPREVTIGDSRILFLSYTNLYPSGLTARGNSPGVSDLDLERISEMVEVFRAIGPGLVVVMMHWGEEYETRSHPIQQQWARGLIDIGVDIVVGHHPHVTQEIERYDTGWIVYSLGNFIFDQYFSEETMRGFAVSFTTQDNTVQSFRVLPYELNELYQPIFRDSGKIYK